MLYYTNLPIHLLLPFTNSPSPPWSCMLSATHTPYPKTEHPRFDRTRLELNPAKTTLSPLAHNDNNDA